MHTLSPSLRQKATESWALALRVVFQMQIVRSTARSDTHVLVHRWSDADWLHDPYWLAVSTDRRDPHNTHNATYQRIPIAGYCERAACQTEWQ